MTIKDTIKKQDEEFIEEGANLEHERWARWQKYVFSKSEWTKDGYVIPKELCLRWQKQIDMPYDKLSEQEKDSDKKETINYLSLLHRRDQAIAEAVREEEKERILKTVLEITDKGFDCICSGFIKDKFKI